MKILNPNGLVDNLYKYVQTNIEIAKVEVQEKIEDTIKKLALIAILAVTCTIFLTFFLITLGLFLNKILASKYLGFLIITVLLGVICGVTYFAIKSFLGQAKDVENLHNL